MTLVDKTVKILKERRARKLARAYRACFFGEGNTLTLEGALVLADLRTQAALFDSAIKRSGDALDRDHLLRMEARRELVLRVLNLLELDPLGIARLKEVDDDA